MAEDLAKDLSPARTLGVSPVKVSDPAFAAMAEQGTVKWAVLQNGDLVAVPKDVMGQEIKHSVLSNGAPVLAAGEATIDLYGNLKYGAEINRYSGHFQPKASSLQIGVDAFKDAGISFKTVTPKLSPESYWGF